jgi:hypothetical protein
MSNKMQRYTVYFIWKLLYMFRVVEFSWNVMAHGDAREGKWRKNWRMEWVASTLHTTPELGVSSITTADTHTSAASSRLNWRPCRFKWTRTFRRKTKSGGLHVYNHISNAVYHHPSSRAQTSVSTASGIFHNVIAICRYRGRVGTGLSVLWVASRQ